MSFIRVSSRGLICAILAVAVASTAPAAHAGVPAPTFFKTFLPDTIGPGSVSTLRFTIIENGGVAVIDIDFSDTLPAGVTLADPANASTDCTFAAMSGGLTAPDGGTTITFEDGQLGAGATCTVSVDVTSSTPGVHMNVSGTLTSSAGETGVATDDLMVVTTLPGFSKSFAPGTVSLGGRSTLTFTMDNTANASRIGNLDFIDNLPAGMLVASPSNASTDCVSAGAPDTTVTAIPGTSVITLDADGNNILAGFEVLSAGATCTVTVDVVATGGGMLDNVSGDLLADFVSAGKASATLEVTVTDLALIKQFIGDPVPPGGTVELEFRIDNFDRFDPATGVAFTDDLSLILPGTPDVVFSSLLANDCGGSVSGVGTSLITFSGGTVAAEGFCTLRVSLTVPALATPGSYTNTTGAVTGTVGGSPVAGNMASDDLFVEPVPLLTKEFLEDGTLLPDPVVKPGDDVVLRFTVTNTSATSGATDVEFLDELTDFGPGTGFLPFPVSVTLPPVPDPPCGVDSSLSLLFIDTDRQGLELTGGSLAAAGMSGDSCTFDVTLSIPAGLAPGVYLNTTEEITATVDGATRTGEPASDTLTVIAAPQLSKAFTDDPVGPGATVTLEFTLTHSPGSVSAATGITFTDDLTFLAGLTATGLPLTEACDPDGPGGDPGTGTLSGSMGDTLLTFMGGTLDPGESCAFSVTLSVPAGAAPGSYTNTTSGVGATVGGLATTSAAASDDLDVAGLVFTKEFLGDPVIPGDTVTLRFTIENIHPTDDATLTSFTDSLSAVLPGTPDLTPVAPPVADDCGGTLSVLASFLQYVGGSVMSGQSCTIDVTVNVPAGAPDGTFLNVTSGLSTSQGTIEPATDLLTVDSNLLQLTKAFTDDPVAPGDSVTLEFTLTNLDALQMASGVDFTDDLAAALTGLTFDSVLFDDCGGTVSGTGTTTVTVMGASLAGGGSCTLRVSLTVPGGAAAGIYTNTTSAVTGMIGGFAVGGDAASDDLEVVQLLGFSKSFDGPTTATGTAVLTFTLTNPGADTAIDVSFSDNLDDVISGLVATNLPLTNVCGVGSELSGTSFLTFTGGELPPMGGMCSFDVDVLVPVTATAGTFPNTTSELFQSGLAVADPATADLTIEPPPTFAKVFIPDTILAGGTSTLEFTIDNTASAIAAGSLDFTDNLPAGVVVATPSVTSNTCGGTLTATAGASVISLTGGSVGAGSTCTVDVDVTSIAAGMHVNTTGDLTSSSGSSGTATDTLTVGAAADVAVTKDDGVTSAVAGASVVYTIVVTNNGPSADPAVSLTDAFPSPPLTCTYTSVAAGGATGNTAMGSGDLAETLSMPAASSVTYTVTCDVDPDATGTLSNTATATASVTDLVPGNDSATDADTVLTAEADLEITKTDSQDPVPAGNALSYTVTVTNNGGPSDATNVTVTETLPAGVTFVSTTGCDNDPNGVPSCDLGTLAPDASKQFTVDVTVDAATPSGTITNTVSVASDATETDASDNMVGEDTDVDADPPTVTLVDSTAGTGDGELAECEEARVAISELRVTFSEPVEDPAGDSDADDVTNPDNYLLVAAGPDNDFSTIPSGRGVAPVCGAAAVGDDVEVPITGVTYDDGTRTATLTLAATLDESLYRLLVCGSTSIRDASGNALDGDGDGTGGDDFARTYRVELGNLLTGGHFDCTIDGWIAVSTVPEEIEYSAEDVDGSSVSGSAEVMNLSASQDFSLGQCAPIVAGSNCTLEGRLRIDAAPGVVLTAASTCEFFPLADCAGAGLGLEVSVAILGDTGGLFDAVGLSAQVPATAASALCSIDLRTATGEDFDAFLDDARLTCDSAIFTDGFESGNTSAWSSQVP